MPPLRSPPSVHRWPHPLSHPESIPGFSFHWPAFDPARLFDRATRRSRLGVANDLGADYRHHTAPIWPGAIRIKCCPWAIEFTWWPRRRLQVRVVDERWDGAGTTLVKDIRSGLTDPDVSSLTNGNGTLYFALAATIQFGTLEIRWHTGWYDQAGRRYVAHWLDQCQRHALFLGAATLVPL